MPNFTVGPGIKQAIMWFSMVSCFAAGWYFGWQSRGSWGLQTELAVHIDDSEEIQKINEWKAEALKEVQDEFNKIQSDHPCAGVPMLDIVRPAKESDTQFPTD